MRVCKFNHVLMFAVSAMLSLSCFAPAEAEEVNFVPEPETTQKEPIVIKILNRFELSNDYGQVTHSDNGAMFVAYQRGLVSENDISRFYSANDYDRKEKNYNFKKISFSMFEKGDDKLSLDVKSKDRSIMLKWTIRSNPYK